jgi:hypothetical protein
MFCPIPNNDSDSSSEMPKMIHNCSGLSPMISLWPLQKMAENHREFLSGWWCNNHLENYEFVNGKDYSHMEKKHVPNQTTNHFIFLLKSQCLSLLLPPGHSKHFQTTMAPREKPWPARRVTSIVRESAKPSVLCYNHWLIDLCKLM